MKVLSIMSVLLLFAVSVVNAHSLNFRTIDGQAFWLVVNGVYVNNSPSSSVNDLRVENDFVTVKVIFNSQRIRTVVREIDARPSSPAQRSKSFVIDKIRHGGYDIFEKGPQRRGNHGHQVVVKEGLHGHEHRAVPVKHVMPPSEFSLLKRNLNSASFDDDKLPIAKLAIRPYFVTVSQVRELSCSFTFGRSRMEFVKYSYDYVVDKEQFYSLSDVFDFHSQRDEFFKFLESKNY